MYCRLLIDTVSTVVKKFRALILFKKQTRLLGSCMTLNASEQCPVLDYDAGKQGYKNKKTSYGL